MIQLLLSKTIAPGSWLYMIEKIRRVPLGIPVLDTVFGGGVIEGSIILVAGNPGTGKTTLAAQIVYNGLKKGEKGIYISFAESKEEFYKYMGLLGFDFKRFEDRGLFKYISLPTISDVDVADLTIQFINRHLEEFGSSRIVVDSITALSTILSQSQIRSFLHTNLIPLLKNYCTIGIVIADIPYGKEYVGYGVEEFIVDGVILLKLRETFSGFERFMEIRKMRGVPIPSINVPFSIIEKEGIRPLLIPPREVLRELSPKEEKIEVIDIQTGIDLVDKFICAGLPRGAQILVVGPSGAGKTYLLTYSTIALARKGLNITYINFEETTAMINYKFRSLGLDEKLSNVRILSMDPLRYGLAELIYYLEYFANHMRPDILVLDGIGALEKVHGSRVFWSILHRIVDINKSKRIITIYSYATDYPETHIPIDTTVDIIYVIKLEIGKEGLVRKLIQWKNRFGITMSKPCNLKLKAEPVATIECVEG